MGVNITAFAVKSFSYYNDVEVAKQSCSNQCQSSSECACFVVLISMVDEKWFCFADSMGGIGRFTCDSGYAFLFSHIP